jgi:hypothetical protein
MPRPASHSISDEFDRRNLFLCATLGLLAELRQFRRAARERTTARPALVLRRPDRTSRGDEALDAALGLVAVSRALAAHARTVATPRRERGPTAPAPAPVAAPRSLLV